MKLLLALAIFLVLPAHDVFAAKKNVFPIPENNIKIDQSVLSTSQQALLDDFIAILSSNNFKLTKARELIEKINWLPKEQMLQMTARYLKYDMDAKQLGQYIELFDQTKLSPKIALYKIHTDIERGISALENNDALVKRLRTVWTASELSLEEEKYFLQKYQRYLEFINQKDKIERMLWEQDLVSAKYLIDRYQGASRKLLDMRLRIAQNPARINVVSLEYNKQYHHDEIVKYYELRHAVLHNPSQVVKLLNEYNQTLKNPKWWRLLKLFTRDSIENRSYDQAIIALSYLDLSGDIDNEEVLWYRGYLAYLKKNYDDAAKYFNKAYDAANFSDAKSRAIYWLVMTYERIGDEQKLQHWRLQTKEHPTKFFTMMTKMHAEKDFLLDISDSYAIDDNIRKIIESSLYIHNKGFVFTSYKLMKYLINSKNPSAKDYAIVAYYQKRGIHFPAVWLGQEMAKRGANPISLTYPILDFQSQPKNKALYHAVIRQESQFDPVVKSGAGAYGLMQIMPATAKDIGKKINISHHEFMIAPRTNIKFGIFYIDQMLEKYDSIILALCAYNAGPGNANKWIAKYGDVRNLRTIEEKMMWVESIPFNETRSYVKKVLENVFIYRHLLGLNTNLSEFIY